MACFSHFETAPLSANERIAEFLDFAIQDEFALVLGLEGHDGKRLAQRRQHL